MRSYFLLALALFSLTGATSPANGICPGSTDKHYFELIRNNETCTESKEQNKIQPLQLTAKKLTNLRKNATSISKELPVEFKFKGCSVPTPEAKDFENKRCVYSCEVIERGFEIECDDQIITGLKWA